MYRTLDPDKIIETIATLERRIAERFPGAGLGRVCAELGQIARENRERTEHLARPNLGLRITSGTVLALGFGLLAVVGSIISVKRTTDDLFGVMQGIEASVNLVIVMGAAVLFLVTLESRWKRRAALADLHELRSIVHVIDMHQLTKDPSSHPAVTPPTPSSPARRLAPGELVRYLDYCSEMLSLTSKVAALYAQSSGDAVVIEAASDIQTLTSNLSQKIWQKIMIVETQGAAEARDEARGAARGVATAPANDDRPLG